MNRNYTWGAASLTGMMLLAGVAFAADEIYQITIKDHQFSPAELKIPANKKVKLIVKNEDSGAEEFESYDLNREKVVSGHSSITLFIGPLKPGSYKYFGEFNPKTAQGVIVAEA